MALLVTGVLWDEVKVLATDDESAVHLGGDDGSGQDTSTDGDLAGEWALLVWGAESVYVLFFRLFFVCLDWTRSESFEFGQPSFLRLLMRLAPLEVRPNSPYRALHVAVSTNRCSFPRWRSLGS